MPLMSRPLPALLLALAACGGPEADVRSRDPYERYLGVREAGDDRSAASVAEIVRLLDDEHALVVTGALEALAAIGDKAFLQHAASKIKHPNPMVRSQACATIAAIRNEEGTAALLEALKDEDPAVRRASVKALAAFGGRTDVKRVLAETVGDKDASVAYMAHLKLREITGRNDVPRSREAWTQAVGP
jgi:HEAT repeat protein